VAGRTPRRAGRPQGSDGADTGCDLAGELAAHGGAAAQTWATASSGAAVASQRIPRDLISFFCIFIFSLTIFCLQNYMQNFFHLRLSFVSDAKKLSEPFFVLTVKIFSSIFLILFLKIFSSKFFS